MAAKVATDAGDPFNFAADAADHFNSSSSSSCRAEARRSSRGPTGGSLAAQAEVAECAESRFCLSRCGSGSLSPASSGHASPAVENRRIRMEAALEALSAVKLSRQNSAATSLSPTTRAVASKRQQAEQVLSGGSSPVNVLRTGSQFEAALELQSIAKLFKAPAREEVQQQLEQLEKKADQGGSSPAVACRLVSQFEAAAKLLSSIAKEEGQAGQATELVLDEQEEEELQSEEEEVPQEESVPQPVESVAPASTGGKPKLFLALPPRGEICGDYKPSQVAPPQTGPTLAVPAAMRTGRRQLPARLQALDDQTFMPRDVYSNMLKAGDEARGRLGYGQHKLAFGPDGTPVLRIAA